MDYRAPEGITSHEGVQECLCGDGGGSDYKHDVFLKEGWEFQNGRTAGCRAGFFNSVTDFRAAAPKQKGESK